MKNYLWGVRRGGGGGGGGREGGGGGGAAEEEKREKKREKDTQPRRKEKEATIRAKRLLRDYLKPCSSLIFSTELNAFSISNR